MEQKTLGLTGNQLKLFALFCMTADHIGIMLFPHRQILRIIGRLAFPIFAWMIAEGCSHTRSMGRYLATLALSGLVCQLAYGIFLHSVYMCIMVTFALSVGLIWLAQAARRKKTALSYCVLFFAVLAAFFVAEVLPGLLPETDFGIDYDFCGIVLPLCIYLAKGKWQKLLICGCVLALLAWQSFTIQWYSLLTLPLLALYNGKRGKWKLKWLFYIYYPAHLVALYFLMIIL